MLINLSVFDEDVEKTCDDLYVRPSYRLINDGKTVKLKYKPFDGDEDIADGAVFAVDDDQYYF